MRKRLLIVALVVTIISGIVAVADTPVIAHDPGDGTQGCTPGYWKNHTENWPAGIFPTDAVALYFANAALYGLGGASLLQALGFSGGSGTVGGARILLREAVAGLLNAAHPDVDYALSMGNLQTSVNVLLATNDRSAMLAGATMLDAFNNLGCPFPSGGK